jgi:hypothetical protein
MATPALVFRPQLAAALGTEFAALRAGAAGRTKGDRFGGEIEISRQVLLAHLFLHLVHGRLHLRHGDLGLDIGGASVAERVLGVPTSCLAHPMGAFRTLAEMALRRFDGFVESLVMRRTLDGALDLIAVGAGGAENAAELGRPRCAGRSLPCRGRRG